MQRGLVYESIDKRQFSCSSPLIFVCSPSCFEYELSLNGIHFQVCSLPARVCEGKRIGIGKPAANGRFQLEQGKLFVSSRQLDAPCKSMPLYKNNIGMSALSGQWRVAIWSFQGKCRDE